MVLVLDFKWKYIRSNLDSKNISVKEYYCTFKIVRRLKKPYNITRCLFGSVAPFLEIELVQRRNKN